MSVYHILGFLLFISFSALGIIRFFKSTYLRLFIAIITQAKIKATHLKHKEKFTISDKNNLLINNANMTRTRNVAYNTQKPISASANLISTRNIPVKKAGWMEIGNGVCVCVCVYVFVENAFLRGNERNEGR